MADRFLQFYQRYKSHFDSKTRSVFRSASHYLKGLVQAPRKNMERMQEPVVDADDQALQYMLTDADWSSSSVMTQVAREADQSLGGSDASGLLLDEMNEVFVVDVHKDQRIYLDDPEPIIPQKQGTRARTPTR